MTRTLLLVLLAVEGGLLALLFLLLLAWPLIRRLERWRRDRRRREVLGAVRQFRDGGDPAELRSVLDRSRPRVLLQALQAVEEADGPPSQAADLRRLVRASDAFRSVRRAAGSRRWWRRQTAAQILGRVVRYEDRELLLELVRDPHPVVSAAALLAVRRLSWPSTAEPLLEIALEGTSVQRGKVELLVDTLVELGPEAVLPSLSRRIEAGRGGEAEATLLRIAGRLGDPRIRPLVRDRLRDGGLETRIQAARTLASLGGEAGRRGLEEALEDPAWEVRAQAARGLGVLGSAEAVGSLRRALTDPSWWVRLRAALALRNIGPRGVRTLEEADPEEDAYAADMAEYVLGLEEAAVREYAR